MSLFDAIHRNPADDQKRIALEPNKNRFVVIHNTEIGRSVQFSSNDKNAVQNFVNSLQPTSFDLNVHVYDNSQLIFKHWTDAELCAIQGAGK